MKNYLKAFLLVVLCLAVATVVSVGDEGGKEKGKETPEEIAAALKKVTEANLEAMKTSTGRCPASTQSHRRLPAPK